MKNNQVFVNRLGRHHFDHLKNIANGIDMQISANKYLGVKNGCQSIAAHKETTESVRILSKQRCDREWRLIGLYIPISKDLSHPSFSDFIVEQKITGVSESEAFLLYTKSYPISHKSIRRQMLREKQFALLHDLENILAYIPLPKDNVSLWFDSLTSRKLDSAGIKTLNDLSEKITAGGFWYKDISGVGVSKANCIKSHLVTILGEQSVQKKKAFSLVMASFQIAPFFTLSTSMISVEADREAIESWIRAKSSSKHTAKMYEGEVRKLLLWLQNECNCLSIKKMSIIDCRNYMAFLQNIPLRWISRSRAKYGDKNLAPFKLQLSHKSQAHSILVIKSMFSWLKTSDYLSDNPWNFVNTKTGDDLNINLLDTKSLSEKAVSEIIKYIELQPPSSACSRFKFILLFLESVGLRSTELLNARFRDIKFEPEVCFMQVYGKGAKIRVVAIPEQALNALQEYLEKRGLKSIETAPSNAPLLASTTNPLSPISYQSLYKHVKSWLKKSIKNSDLSSNERKELDHASTHWLRYIFCTRSVERGVPMDVIQAQIGHSSITTTMSVYGRAPIKRLVNELNKAF